MNEDEIIKDEEVDELEPKLPPDVEKSKDVLDEEPESVEDLADDELAVDKEDLMDDVEEM